MTTATAEINPLTAPPPSPGERLDDLAQIIRAYNSVTENLQKSHDALRAQVARLQEELASTDAQLQRSKRLAALGEMAAGIAHEVRNPLAAIQLYTGMLIQDLSPETVGLPGALDTARRIADAVRGLDGIVSDVLSFARDIVPRPAVLPVRQVFDRVVEAQRPALEAGGIVVRRRAAGQRLSVHADADLLHQALLNLVRNAIQAMTEDQAPPRRELTLAARRDPAAGGRIVMGVRDTGPGIAQQDIDRIFNPFFTTRNTGTGLGLAIVHRIVDAHGGTIAVRNDRGAVFELSLPIPSPLAGEGGPATPGRVRGKPTATNDARYSRAFPSPQPSPARGEGAGVGVRA